MNTFRKCILGNSLLSRLFQEKCSVASMRYLYNEQFLGIDKYVEARERTISRLGSMKDNFYNRMRSQMNSSVPSMIFTEDLKTVIHSCDDKEEDLEMCIKMMKRFHKQNKELRFGTFVFGPVAMRLFYYLKKEAMVKEFLKDTELEGFFNQLKSYYLSMDLYFKSGSYGDILSAFEEVQAKNLGETRFPREAVVLTTAACYKINTPESFQLASDLITQAREARVTVLRKALTFVIALALNQKKPDVALEILSSVDRFNHITANNLKVLAYSGLNRLTDVFDILRRITDQDAPVYSKIRGAICQGTLDEVQRCVEGAGDEESRHIFEQLCRSLKESNSITDQTIDELVCLPIEPRMFPRDTDSSFNQRGRFPDQGFRERSFGGDRFSLMDDAPRRRRFAGISDDF